MKKYFILFALTLPCAVISLLIIGCEAGVEENTAAIAPSAIARPVDSNLRISPTDVILLNMNDTITFYATGGKPPYRWAVLNNNGTWTVNPDMKSGVYTRITAATTTNMLMLSDSAGDLATASIKQPEVDLAVMAQNPGAITITADNNPCRLEQVCLLTAINGINGNQYWWYIVTGDGWITPTYGSNTVYTCGASTNSTAVAVTDGSSTAIINIDKDP
jgi:hypothetical protein